MSEILPRHLSDKITWRTWCYINTLSSRWLHESQQRPIYYRAKFWQIRSWLITYVMNPSEENRNFLLQMLEQYKMVEDNLELLQIFWQIHRRQRRAR